MFSVLTSPFQRFREFFKGFSVFHISKLLSCLIGIQTAILTRPIAYQTLTLVNLFNSENKKTIPK